jgi:CubicO group peptidase (beta-lactamase class C family)
MALRATRWNYPGFLLTSWPLKTYKHSGFKYATINPDPTSYENKRYIHAKSQGGAIMRFYFVSVSLLILFVFTFGGINSSFAQDDSYADFTANVDSLLAPQIIPDGPGAAVVVIQKGKVIYHRCFGLASLEHKVPITHETVFNLASVAKQFTALAILMLEREGKLQLDDDIHKYFPELPDYGAEVTLHNLLHHTSGLWEYSTMFRYYGGHNPVDYTSMEDVLTLLKGQDQLLFAPGSQWVYCNTNYALLGELVARVTGESLASWTNKNIFILLSMKSTFFRDDCNTVIPHGAGCYYKTGGVYKSNLSNSEVVGEGYLFSNIDDIVLWLDNFRLHTVGGDSLIGRMFKKSSLNDGSENFYGYGLGVSEHDGRLTIGHSGQTGSFMSMMIYVPEDEIGIAILANNGHIKAESLAYDILDIFYGMQKEKEEMVAPEESKPFISLDSIDTEGLTGAYLIDGNAGRLLLSRLESGFYGIFDGIGSDLFRPVSDTQLANALRNVSINIYRPNNEPVRIMLDINGDTMWASHVDKPVLSEEQLAADYAGTYYCNALGVAYDVVMENGRLVIRYHRYADRPLELTDRDEFVGSIGIVRFSRNEQGIVKSFEITDEDTNFKPLIFARML